MARWVTMREAVGRLVCVTAAITMLTACGASQRKNDVWDNYDIREPLAHDSDIPDSQAQVLRDNDPYRVQPQYIDNDSYYTLPTIQCGIGDLPACVSD